MLKFPYPSNKLLHLELVQIAAVGYTSRIEELLNHNLKSIGNN
jgi:hypothetical protein